MHWCERSALENGTFCTWTTCSEFIFEEYVTDNATRFVLSSQQPKKNSILYASRIFNYVFLVSVVIGIHFAFYLRIFDKRLATRVLLCNALLKP